MSTPQLGARKSEGSGYGDLYGITTLNQKTPVIYRKEKKDGVWENVEEFNEITMVVDEIKYEKKEIRKNETLSVTLLGNTGADGQSSVSFLLNWYTRTILDRLGNIKDITSQILTIKVGTSDNDKGETWPWATVVTSSGTVESCFDSDGRRKMANDPDKWAKFIDQKIKPNMTMPETITGPEGMELALETTDAAPAVEDDDQLPF